MGRKDIEIKRFLKMNDIFAQIFNGGLFQGTTIIDENSLIDMDPVEEMFLKNKNGGVHIFERSRDVKKKSKLGCDFSLVILGIEEQTSVNYYMPIRNKMYEALDYENQIKQIQESCEESGISYSYSAGVPKGTKVLPVLTVVLYLGSKIWDGPRDIYDMFDLNTQQKSWLEQYIPHYPIHIIDVRHMTDEELEQYNGDVQIFFYMLRNQFDTDKLRHKNLIAKHRETWYAIGVMKNDQRYIDYIDSIQNDENKGDIAMCEILDYFENKGKLEGQTEGERKKLISLVCKKVSKGKTLSIIADELEETEDNISPIYEIVKSHAPEFDIETIYKELVTVQK